MGGGNIAFNITAFCDILVMYALYGRFLEDMSMEAR